MKPRILTAGFFHETHSFVEETTPWSSFDVVEGEAVLRKLGDGSPTDGFLEEAARQGFAVIPTIDARATPGGTVADRALMREQPIFRSLAHESIISRLRGYGRQVDAVRPGSSPSPRVRPRNILSVISAGIRSWEGMRGRC